MALLSTGFVFQALFVLVLVIFDLPTTLASSAAGTETLVGIVGKDFILVGADSSVSQSISLTASNLDKIAAVSEPFLQTDTRSATPWQQQTIVVAAAGDSADSDRLVGLLQAHATMQEYQSGVGADVDYYKYRTTTTTTNLKDGDSNDDAATEPGLNVEAMAYLARGQIASALRSRTPLNVCLLIAGMMATSDEINTSFVAERVQHQTQGAWTSTSTRSGTPPTAQAVERTDSTSMATAAATTIGRSALQPRLFWLDEYGSLQNIPYGAHGHGANFCLSILDQGYRPDLSLEEATKLLRDCFQQLRTRYVINSPRPPCIKCVDANGVRLIR
jgi:20S proteasome alpha/beta subunit